jgi:hypothetical protein
MDVISINWNYRNQSPDPALIEWLNQRITLASTSLSLDNLLSLLHQKLDKYYNLIGTDLILSIPIKGRKKQVFSARTNLLLSSISDRYPTAWA